MKKIWELKSLLKELASTIRKTKDAIKRKQKAREYAGSEQSALVDLKRDFRHKHIAYCLIRGRSYDRIEKPREGNEPDQTLIKEIMDAYAEPAQDVRACA